MRLVWTVGARREFADIVVHIWSDDPGAAKRIRSRIENTANYLKSHPFMGRSGAIAGTREAIPHPSYRIVYEVGEDAVFILSVVHTSRQWPPAADEDDI